MTTAGDLRFKSANVVVAMANYQVPRVPEFARELDSAIVQLHSHHYRNPAQLKEGGVLVVGVGNSGADIGMEVAQIHPTWMSGKEYPATFRFAFRDFHCTQLPGAIGSLRKSWTS